MKRGIITYFDSFSKLKQPRNLAEYLGPKVKIYYNNEAYESYNQSNRRHLPLKFLKSQSCLILMLNFPIPIHLHSDFSY